MSEGRKSKRKHKLQSRTKGTKKLSDAGSRYTNKQSDKGQRETEAMYTEKGDLGKWKQLGRMKQVNGITREEAKLRATHNERSLETM